MPVLKVTLAEAKVHLRVDHDDEDGLINSLIAAAYLAVEGSIFRKVYVAAPDLEADPVGVLVDEAINTAALLIVGHLYANREAVSRGVGSAAQELPMGVEWLLTPYLNLAGGC